MRGPDVIKLLSSAPPSRLGEPFPPPPPPSLPSSGCISAYPTLSANSIVAIVRVQETYREVVRCSSSSPFPVPPSKYHDITVPPVPPVPPVISTQHPQLSWLLHAFLRFRMSRNQESMTPPSFAPRCTFLIALTMLDARGDTGLSGIICSIILQCLLIM